MRTTPIPTINAPVRPSPAAHGDRPDTTQDKPAAIVRAASPCRCPRVCGPSDSPPRRRPPPRRGETNGGWVHPHGPTLPPPDTRRYAPRSLTSDASPSASYSWTRTGHSAAWRVRFSSMADSSSSAKPPRESGRFRQPAGVGPREWRHGMSMASTSVPLGDLDDPPRTLLTSSLDRSRCSSQTAGPRASFPKGESSLDAVGAVRVCTLNRSPALLRASFAARLFASTSRHRTRPAPRHSLSALY